MQMITGIIHELKKKNHPYTKIKEGGKKGNARNCIKVGITLLE